MTERNTSTVLCFEGPRGGGKTLSLVFDAVERMLRGVKVLSNFPIEFALDWEDGNDPVYYQSEPLNMNSLYSMGGDLCDAHICIDELPLWADSRRSMGVANRLINAMFTMIRKRNLSFCLTSQQFKWLDSRVKYQVDLLGYCTDLSFKYPNLERGSFIGMQLRDMSGVLSGTTYEVNGRVLSGTLFGKFLWDSYNSWQEYDIVGAYQKLKIAGGPKVIKLGEVNGAYVDGGLNDQTKFFISSMAAEGQETISAEVVKQKLAEYGITAELPVVGREFKRLGVTRKRTRQGDFYNFPSSGDM